MRIYEGFLVAHCGLEALKVNIIKGKVLSGKRRREGESFNRKERREHRGNGGCSGHFGRGYHGYGLSVFYLFWGVVCRDVGGMST